MMPRFGVCFIIINVIITRRNNIMAMLIITAMIMVIILTPLEWMGVEVTVGNVFLFQLQIRAFWGSMVGYGKL